MNDQTAAVRRDDLPPVAMAAMMARAAFVCVRNMPLAAMAMSNCWHAISQYCTRATLLRRHRGIRVHFAMFTRAGAPSMEHRP